MSIRQELIRAGVLKPNRNGYRPVQPQSRRGRGGKPRPAEEATTLPNEDELAGLVLDEVGRREAEAAIAAGPIWDWQLRAKRGEE